MKENVVVFLGTFTKQGKDWVGYNFAELGTNQDGKLFGRSNTLFSQSPIDVSKLIPGDVVRCSFAPPAFLDGKPTLCGITFIRHSNLLG